MNPAAQIIVLADDFSGAAEVGGIGTRYGLSAEVQLEPDFSSTAPLMVLDTHTRSVGEKEAVQKLRGLAGALMQLQTSGRTLHLFKKVDSAMRGHLIPEIEVLQDVLGIERVLLLPANPGKGRTIKDGRYWIRGHPLDRSVFKDDPAFPAVTSSIEEMMRSASTTYHISHTEPLPPRGLITGDLCHPSDFAIFLKNATSRDLIAGAAECFAAFLEHLGYREAPTRNGADTSDGRQRRFTLFVNGSTVMHPEDRQLFKRMGIPVCAMPGVGRGAQFVVGEREAEQWRADIMDGLAARSIVVATIDQPIQRSAQASQTFLDRFAWLIQHIAAAIDLAELHIGLTGGTTASSILRRMGWGTLHVVEERAPGVVTLASTQAPVRFTVKPGSYRWPVSLLSHAH